MACYHAFSDVLANSDLGDFKCDYFRLPRHPGGTAGGHQRVISTFKSESGELRSDGAVTRYNTRAFPAYYGAGRYPLSWRVSHDFAKSQSRLTVREEMFRASAMSSSLNPLK